MKSMPIITPTTTQNPKSLVMLDATGKVATLKLTTSTGLHVYDGSMLWVNPAQSVTAAAPRTSQSTPQPPQHKSTKALPIVDPTTGEEIVVKKPDPPPQAAAPSPSPLAAPPIPGSAPIPTPAAQLAVAPPATSSPAAAPTKEQNIIDLLAKATKTTPSALLAMSQPLLSSAMPPIEGRGRGRGRDYDEDDYGRDRTKGRGAKGAAKVAPADVKGKGKGAKGLKAEAGHYSGERYTKDAKYTASLDGRFWSLSLWPTGERDESHRLTFGKHKLEVLEHGLVKVVLFGGVNRYKIRLHLATEGDENGSEDKDGWGVATCEPSAANLQLSEEAEQLGWKIYKGGEHPLLYPPGVPLPESGEAAGAEATKVETKEEAKPEKSEVQPEVQSEAKPEAKPEASTEAKSEAKPEASTEAKPEASTEAKPEAKPEGTQV